MRKMLFGSGSAHPKKLRKFFTIAPVLTSTLTVCCRNHSDPSLLRLRVRYKYYRKKSRSGLAWSCPRADRGL